jgi:hypothetical protein
MYPAINPSSMATGTFVGICQASYDNFFKILECYFEFKKEKEVRDIFKLRTILRCS